MEKVNFIMINTNKPDPATMKEVLAGIEEEGLYPGFTKEVLNRDAITLAYMAADMSSMGVGIGIDGRKVQLAVKDQVRPLIIETKGQNPRAIGQNAARYIKNNPLII